MHFSEWLEWKCKIAAQSVGFLYRAVESFRSVPVWIFMSRKDISWVESSKLNWIVDGGDSWSLSLTGAVRQCLERSRRFCLWIPSRKGWPRWRLPGWVLCGNPWKGLGMVKRFWLPWMYWWVGENTCPWMTGCSSLGSFEVVFRLCGDLRNLLAWNFMLCSTDSMPSLCGMFV